MFGEGNDHADVMFIGEAPGRLEDETGRPFVGRSGQLLESLLAEVGIARDAVFITSVVKCRPPANRDPKRDEISACSKWLEGQLELIRPNLICTLGNFALRLLSGDGDGITSVHGQERPVTLQARTFRMYPLFHPAAALRSTRTKALLRADIARIPDLAALPPLPRGQSLTPYSGDNG